MCVKHCRSNNVLKADVPESCLVSGLDGDLPISFGESPAAQPETVICHIPAVIKPSDTRRRSAPEVVGSRIERPEDRPIDMKHLTPIRSSIHKPDLSRIG